MNETHGLTVRQYPDCEAVYFYLWSAPRSEAGRRVPHPLGGKARAGDGPILPAGAQVHI